MQKKSQEFYIEANICEKKQYPSMQLTYMYIQSDK